MPSPWASSYRDSLVTATSGWLSDRRHKNPARKECDGSAVGIKAPVGFPSLPTELLFDIVSYLSCLDRFRLKMVGNHHVTDSLSTLRRPSFEAYLAQLDKFTSKVWSSDQGREKALDIACEEGNDALILKLLDDRDGRSYLNSHTGMRKRLIAATISHQESAVRILLGHIPTASIRSFEPRHPKRWNKGRLDLIYIALAYAARYGDESITRLLLKQVIWIASRGGASAIYNAASNGHHDIVVLLSKRVFWRRSHTLSLALIGAAEKGHEATTRYLLERGANANASISGSPSRPGAIHLAAKEGHETIIRLLLSKGVEDSYVSNSTIPQSHSRFYQVPNLTYQNWCCLHFAIYGQQYHIVKLLLDMRIMPRDQNQYRAAALPLAAMRGYTDIVKLLLNSGFQVSATLLGETALELAATYGNAKVIGLLLDTGAATAGEKALHLAIKHGFSPTVSLLLDRGVSIEAKDTLDHTPLHLAVLHQRPIIVRVLLKAGARTDVHNCRAETPLLRAIITNQVPIVDLLLKYRAATAGVPMPIPETKFRSEIESALWCSISCNSSELVLKMLQYGVDIEEQGPNGQRAIHRAAVLGRARVLEILLSSGADKHARDTWQRTALHYAAALSSVHAVDALLSWGLDLEAKDYSGKTPLHMAGEHRYTYEFLVGHGADPSAKDHSGKSAYDYMAQYRNRASELHEGIGGGNG